MFSKNKKTPTRSERAHIARIKSMPCVVCGAAPPTDCHEVKQGQWFTGIPLCRDCHTGSHNGIHGRRAMWDVMKMDEIDAIAKTVERIIGTLQQDKMPMQTGNRFINELSRIVTGALRLDIDKVKNYTAFLADNLERSGDVFSANQIRKILDHQGVKIYPADEDSNGRI